MKECVIKIKMPHKDMRRISDKVNEINQTLQPNERITAVDLIKTASLEYATHGKPDNDDMPPEMKVHLARMSRQYNKPLSDMYTLCASLLWYADMRIGVDITPTNNAMLEAWRQLGGNSRKYVDVIANTLKKMENHGKNLCLCL